MEIMGALVLLINKTGNVNSFSTAIGLHPKPGGPDAHVVLAMANDPILQSTPQENTSASVELGALNNSALPGKYRRDAIHCR